MRTTCLECVYAYVCMHSPIVCICTVFLCIYTHFFCVYVYVYALVRIFVHRRCIFAVARHLMGAVRTHVCTYVCMYVCICIYTRVSVYRDKYTVPMHPLPLRLNISAHTYMHTYINTYIHTYIHAQNNCSESQAMAMAAANIQHGS